MSWFSGRYSKNDKHLTWDRRTTDMKIEGSQCSSRSVGTSKILMGTSLCVGRNLPRELTTAFSIKVHIFWEGHYDLMKASNFIRNYLLAPIFLKILSDFCCLLRFIQVKSISQLLLTLGFIHSSGRTVLWLGTP